MQPKALDLIINNPPAHLFSETAQLMVAGGVLIFCLCWGIAKIVKARRGE